MKTKHLVWLMNRWAQLEADIELIDAFATLSKSGSLSKKGPYLFDSLEKKKHPRLSARVNSDHGRKVAISHLRNTVGSAFFKDAYEDVLIYLASIMESAARAGLDPRRLIGEHKVEIQANEILKAGDWPAVVHLVTQSVFRRLENEKSTKELLKKANDKLNLNIDQTKIDAALPYLELRHLLVHNDGVADEDFVKRFPSFGAKSGEKFKIGYKLIQDGREALLALVREFDSKAVAQQLVKPPDLQN